MNFGKIVNKKFILSFLLLILLIFNGNMLGMIVHPTAQKGTQLSYSKNGSVILLLGTSSAGKSRAFKEIIDFATSFSESKEVVSIVMDSEDDRGISRNIRDQFPFDWSHEQVLLYQSIVKHAKQNKTVIADLVLFESIKEDITESFITKLKTETNVFSILVYCPMHQLLRNVAIRNQSPQECESRSPVHVIGQYLEMYCSSDPIYDNNKVETYSPIDIVDSKELLDGITSLSSYNEDNFETQSKQTHIAKLQTLYQRSSSPVVINSDIYNIVLKNSGYNFEENTKLVFDKLFHWFKTS